MKGMGRLMIVLGVAVSAERVAGQQIHRIEPAQPTDQAGSPAAVQGISIAEATTTSAFEALRLLPPQIAKRIALIEGRDGSPIPQRWYLVVYDPAQEHHLAEYVVADNRVVAARALSQFAQELSADDVIPTDSALLNSDRAYQILAQFAQANNLRASRVNYELKKQGAGAVPLWKITCTDESSTQFAQMTLAAATGTVIQTDGFNFAPTRGVLAQDPYPAERQARASAPQEISDSFDSNEPMSRRRDEDRQVARDSSSYSNSNRHNRDGAREPRLIGRKVGERGGNPAPGSAHSPPPVAQRPSGLFGAIRRLFAR